MSRQQAALAVNCLPKGSIVVMDRGYIDYKLFSRWTKEGIRFVTRLKEKADYVAWEST